MISLLSQYISKLGYTCTYVHSIFNLLTRNYILSPIGAILWPFETTIHSLYLYALFWHGKKQPFNWSLLCSWIGLQAILLLLHLYFTYIIITHIPFWFSTFSSVMLFGASAYMLETLFHPFLHFLSGFLCVSTLMAPVLIFHVFNHFDQCWVMGLRIL